MGGQPWDVLSPHEVKTLLFMSSFSCHSQLPPPVWDVYCVHWNWPTGQQGLWAACSYRAGSMGHCTRGCCALPQKCRKWIKKIAMKRLVTQLGLHCPKPNITLLKEIETSALSWGSWANGSFHRIESSWCCSRETAGKSQVHIREYRQGRIYWETP